MDKLGATDAADTMAEVLSRLAARLSTEILPQLETDGKRGDNLRRIIQEMHDVSLAWMTPPQSEIP
ncbi:MAG: hypothetical protein F8N36_14365 [Desulfovibrio sp.]|uniref:hypothetical protein n=1 Tax=Desulfovibrio sp. TaxID=885 RepID=UPI00135E2505|nr:hypothetical protein [Desulfovibrio sp.]MTJ94022.1 hypothetical protein [Desulfovibrio sp.]